MVKPDADQEGETIKTASFVTHNSGGRTQRTMQDPQGKHGAQLTGRRRRGLWASAFFCSFCGKERMRQSKHV